MSVDHQTAKQTAFGWLVVGQSRGEGLAYGVQALRQLCV